MRGCGITTTLFFVVVRRAIIPCNFCLSSKRARWIRLRTVPTGQPICSAISSYFIPSTSESTKAVRYSFGNSDRACRTRRCRSACSREKTRLQFGVAVGGFDARGLAEAIERDRLARLFPPLTGRRIEGDPVQPRVKGRLLPKSVQFLKRQNERFLSHIRASSSDPSDATRVLNNRSWYRWTNCRTPESGPHGKRRSARGHLASRSVCFSKNETPGIHGKFPKSARQLVTWEKRGGSGVRGTPQDYRNTAPVCSCGEQTGCHRSVPRASDPPRSAGVPGLQQAQCVRRNPFSR